MEGKIEEAIWCKHTKSYKIDCSKVNTIEDIKDILKSLDFTINENSPKFEAIEHLLTEVEKCV